MSYADGGAPETGLVALELSDRWRNSIGALLAFKNSYRSHSSQIKNFVCCVLPKQILLHGVRVQFPGQEEPRVTINTSYDGAID